LLPSGSMATYVGSFRPLIVGASVRFLPSSQSARALARTRAATTLVSRAPITTSTTSPRINSGGRGARLTAWQGSIESRDDDPTSPRAAGRTACAGHRHHDRGAVQRGRHGRL